jgi:hypothetical protein
LPEQAEHRVEKAGKLEILAKWRKFPAASPVSSAPAGRLRSVAG